MTKLCFRHHSRSIIHSGKHYYVTNFFKKLSSAVEERYPDYSFSMYSDRSYEQFGYGGTFSCMSMSILNKSNGKYFLFSFFDNWKYHFMSHMGWSAEKMVKFYYASGFNFFDYYHFKYHNKANPDTRFPSDMDEIYEPIAYSPYYDCCFDVIDNLYHSRKSINTIDKLFFRGYMWDFRKSMTTELSKLNDVLILDKNLDNQNIEYQQYLTEISKYKCCLSLPGGTEICNRDIECFAVGVPVLRPLISTNYKDPLIPNYHYISCYHNCDYLGGGNPRFLNYKDMQKNTEYVWNNVKNNQEYLDFISHNARKWYERNCGIENSINSCLNSMDLELLL